VSVIAAHPSAPVAGSLLEVRAGRQLRNSSVLPVLCSLTAEPIRNCHVTASVVVDGRVVVVGRGSAHLDGRPSAHKVAVPVEFNEVGRSLAQGADGVSVTIEALVAGVDAMTFTVSQLHRLAGAA
jgi:hypothetical protein